MLGNLVAWRDALASGWRAHGPLFQLWAAQRRVDLGGRSLLTRRRP